MNQFWNTVHGKFWEQFTVEDARATMTLGDAADDDQVIESINDVSRFYLR